MPEIVDLTDVSPGLMAAAGTVQVAAGQSIVRGGIEFTCAAGGTDCTVTIANDGTATSTGGAVTAMNAMASEFGEERLMASPLASPEASSAADTLASFVDSDVSFGPVVAPVKYETDEFGDRGLVPLDDGDGAAYVESVTVLDSQGRFSIVYVVDDVRTEVEFGPEHVVGEDQIYGHYRWYNREVDNTQYHMWTHPTFSNLQPVVRQYFGLFGWGAGNSRGFASAGVLTRPDNLARLSSATYTGQVVADWWSNFEDPNLSTYRSRLWGALTLEANFSEGNISGRIDDLWSEAPGTAYTNQYWERLSGTTSIEVLEGEIDGNRFHAEWIGRDETTNPALHSSVLGFDGSLLGEFYGPNGEETGGVITGQRELGSESTFDAPHQIINGVFGAER